LGGALLLCREPAAAGAMAMLKIGAARLGLRGGGPKKGSVHQPGPSDPMFGAQQSGRVPHRNGHGPRCRETVRQARKKKQEIKLRRPGAPPQTPEN